MNFLIEIIKIFGNQSQKINALRFDNDKLADEIRYLVSILDNSCNKNQTNFIMQKIQYIESSVYSNNEKIQRLQS